MEPIKVLAPLIRSPQWVPLEKYLTERKESLMKKLLTCQPDELVGLQGAVRELDTLLRTKADLMAAEKH